MSPSLARQGFGVDAFGSEIRRTPKSSVMSAPLGTLRPMGKSGLGKGSRGKSRQRLTGEEARARILDAALSRLRKVGPDGLRLTRLAKELGISHPAILHHFGNREGLVVAVVRRALGALDAELKGGLRVLDQEPEAERGAEALIDRAFDVMGDGGFGRLLIWLGLAGEGEQAAGHLSLQALAAMIHAMRTRDGSKAHSEDTLFMMITAAYVVLGASVFGDLMLASVGLGDDPEAKLRYRRWFKDVFLSHLAAEES